MKKIYQIDMFDNGKGLEVKTYLLQRDEDGNNYLTIEQINTILKALSKIYERIPKDAMAADKIKKWI